MSSCEQSSQTNSAIIASISPLRGRLLLPMALLPFRRSSCRRQVDGSCDSLRSRWSSLCCCCCCRCRSLTCKPASGLLQRADVRCAMAANRRARHPLRAYSRSIDLSVCRTACLPVCLRTVLPASSPVKALARCPQLTTTFSRCSSARETVTTNTPESS